MNIPKITALFCCLASTSAFAQSIDADRYFAYTEVRSNNPRLLPLYILLSQEKCQATGTSKGGRKASYLYPAHRQHGCWDDYGGDLVTVCPATGERGQLGNACVDISASRFIDTSTLPRSASFR